MNSLNQIIIEGNTTRDLELKALSNGRNLCTLPVAVNSTYRNKEGQYINEVSYFDVDAYGNLADVCIKWCPKGRGVRVVGHLKQERWTDPEGKTHSKVKVVAEHIEFKPVYKKDGAPQTQEKKGPEDAYAGDPPATKKEKLAMLAEAAAAAQKETEEVTF